MNHKTVPVTPESATQRLAPRLRRTIATFVVALMAAVVLPFATAAPASASGLAWAPASCQGSATYAWYSSCTYALPGESATSAYRFVDGELLRSQRFTRTVASGTVYTRTVVTNYVYNGYVNSYIPMGNTWTYSYRLSGSVLTYHYDAQLLYISATAPSFDGPAFFRWR